MNSPYFYSWKGGYKLNIILYPQGNGDGKGTHLSIFIWAWNNGEFDQTLSKSTFECELEFALLSQQEDKDDLVVSEHDVPLCKLQRGHGRQTFIPLEQLENSPYLKNDTIFIKVTCTKD